MFINTEQKLPYLLLSNKPATMDSRLRLPKPHGNRIATHGKLTDCLPTYNASTRLQQHASKHPWSFKSCLQPPFSLTNPFPRVLSLASSPNPTVTQPSRKIPPPSPALLSSQDRLAELRRKQRIDHEHSHFKEDYRNKGGRNHTLMSFHSTPLHSKLLRQQQATSSPNPASCFLANLTLPYPMSRSDQACSRSDRPGNHGIIRPSRLRTR